LGQGNFNGWGVEQQFPPNGQARQTACQRFAPHPIPWKVKVGSQPIERQQGMHGGPP